jgi:UDP-2-acetamido-2-deoxy-ribo-hexuluronate aminotransferase
MDKINEIAKKFNIPVIEDTCQSFEVISVFAQYSIQVKDRKSMIEKLSEQEIPTVVHYPVPLHLQEAFNYLDYKEGDFPISEMVASQIMSFPMTNI